ncbi:hypothetical protein TY91_03030 [Secundilactobacillus collinoides]|uniref:Uncharacterized protein n=1 Tax=Secundilactobacillus collinoides TaxID=33960 RepID=A0A161V803_SECCO|nr:hypothetical protein TY91_03030 [Secundilactobacillus collinoides]
MLKDVFSFSNGRSSVDSMLVTFIDVAADSIETVIDNNATPQSHYPFKLRSLHSAHITLSNVSLDAADD